MAIILFNNQFIPEKKAKISLLSNSLGRGFGLFETLITRKDKKLFKPEAHLSRLLKSAKTIELPIKYSQNDILKMLSKLLKKLKSTQSYRIKIIAIEEGIVLFALSQKIDSKIYRGVAIKSFTCNRSMPEIKSTSYLASYVCHQKAVKANCYDALLVDEKQQVYEGAYSNIFWFEDNNLCTRKDQVLPGITRDTILKISPYEIKFKTISLTELKKKKEVFLTQSTTGIVPITKIDKQQIAKGQVGTKTEELKTLLENHIQKNSKNLL